MRFKLHQAQKSSRRIGADEVSLTKTNMLLSEELAEEHFPGVKQVVLLFDEEQRAIAVRGASGGEIGYKLSARSVTMKSFYLHFGINERGRFRAQFKDGLLIIPLGSKSLT